MSLEIARTIVGAFEIYMLVGLVFACLFLPGAIARVDPRVAGAHWTLRILILPGVVAFWPLFGRRWITGAREPIENNPHRTKARAPSGSVRTNQSEEAVR